MINLYGGLKKDGGLLQNKRNQIKKSDWAKYGITPIPMEDDEE